MYRFNNEILYCTNYKLFPVKVNSNTIELTLQTSCYCILDLLCVRGLIICHTNFPSNELYFIRFKDNYQIKLFIKLGPGFTDSCSVGEGTHSSLNFG